MVTTITSKQNLSDFLTQIDTGMQKQAYLTQQIWMETGSISNKVNKQEIIEIIGEIWESNYSTSFILMKEKINNLKNISNNVYILDKICEIALDICKSRIITVKIMDKNFKNAQLEYETGYNLINKDEYNLGFEHLEKAFTECENLIKGQIIQSSDKSEKNDKLEFGLYLLVIILVILAVFLLLRLKSA